jgi:hypothetical protein
MEDHPMFAVNHAATTLLLKKRWPDVPLVWLLLSVQILEIGWVLLNVLGVERTTTEAEVRYVGDIHLSHMPFSHSLLTCASDQIGFAARRINGDSGS